ncbi:hypothetical protein SESBI_39212 [Sesbania bispinosa]|nr:hypothetical protein SESBI_39212 [Sesbania bispinosa]
MAKSNSRNKPFSDGCLFLAGAFSAILLVWGLSSFTTPVPNDNPNFESLSLNPPSNDAVAVHKHSTLDLLFDPLDRTFYDDPEMGYTMDKKVRDWDEKRQEWLQNHTSFSAGAKERVLMVTGSQPSPCRNPIGDHLLLSSEILQEQGGLLSVTRAAMMAHPEAEWIRSGVAGGGEDCGGGVAGVARVEASGGEL